MTIHTLTRNFRLGIVCLAAISISLPIVWISLSKILLILTGLGVVLFNFRSIRDDTSLLSLWTPKAILITLVIFGLSWLWTEVDHSTATWSFFKHLKLIEIVLILALIRTARESRITLVAFAIGQIFLLASSWALFAGMPIPWITNPIGKNVVFSSYLDQSIILATAAAVLWHLRSEQILPRWLAIGFAVLALTNVFLLLEGRTGYLVALVLLALASMWAMPLRWRLMSFVGTPVIVLLTLFLLSSQVRERIGLAFNESQKFSQSTESAAPLSSSSMGWRFNAWHRSLQAIQEKPVLGHGVGSWTPAVKKFEGSTAIENFGHDNYSNPHEEFLLWGVELGMTGMFLLLILMIVVIKDSSQFSPAYKQASRSILAAIAVACLFNSALYDDLMGDFLCISLGLVMALGYRSTSRYQSNQVIHGKST